MGREDYSMYAASVRPLFVLISEFPSGALRAAASLGMIHKGHCAHITAQLLRGKVHQSCRTVAICAWMASPGFS
jgi:hypothetical protein